jgi:hypothetical protein
MRSSSSFGSLMLVPVRPDALPLWQSRADGGFVDALGLQNVLVTVARSAGLSRDPSVTRRARSSRGFIGGTRLHGTYRVWRYVCIGRS